MPKYDEQAISSAQENWRKIDLPTWGKKDEASIKARHDALLELLCAHVPVSEPN